MKLFERIERYLTTMMTPNTQRTYRRAFTQWCRYLGAEYGTAEAARLVVRATPRRVEKYVAFLRERRGNTPRNPNMCDRVTDSSILAKSVAIISIYRHLVKHKHIKHCPWDCAEYRLRPHKNLKRPTKMVPYDKIACVLRAALCSAEPLRDAAVIALWFGGGLRRDEPRELFIDDVRENPDGSVVVRLRNTKNGHDREQIVSREMGPHVSAYVKHRIRTGALNTDYLFVARGRPRKVSTHTLYGSWVRALTRAGLDPRHYSPHSARATAITKLLDDGVPHREVQEFSRHASVRMVERYDKRVVFGDIGRDLCFSVDASKKVVH